MTTDPAITKLLERANSGDQEASARVWEVTLAELRSLAVKRLSRDALARDLQPTELVDEVWIRMAGGKGGIAEFIDRGMFFGTAWRVMGQILVDQSRRRESIKRGGGLKQVSFEFAEGELEHMDTIGEQGLEIRAALDKLARVDPKSHSVAIMKLFFSGQNLRIAEAEDMEKSEVDRLWRYARCFLKDEIRKEDSA